LYPHPRLNGEGHSGPPNQHTCLVLSSFASSKIFTIRSASLPNPLPWFSKLKIRVRECFRFERSTCEMLSAEPGPRAFTLHLLASPERR